MLYVYPDDFIVPVIFVKNVISKRTSEKLNDDLNREKFISNVKDFEEMINNGEQEKFRNDDKKECYDKLQEEFVMEWKHEGKYALEVDFKSILDCIDEEFVSSETDKI